MQAGIASLTADFAASSKVAHSKPSGGGVSTTAAIATAARAVCAFCGSTGACSNAVAQDRNGIIFQAEIAHERDVLRYIVDLDRARVESFLAKL